MRNSRKPRRKETEVLAIKHPLQTSHKSMRVSDTLWGLKIFLLRSMHSLTAVLGRQAAKTMPNAQEPNFPNRNEKKKKNYFFLS